MPLRTMIKGIIFDLDGVIVDTAKYHFQAWQRLAHSIGGELTIEENEQLKGVSRMDSLDKILFWNRIELSKEHKVSLSEKKNQWYQDLIADMTPEDAIPGAIAFIESAKEDGYKIALGSASKNAPRILDGLQIAELFDAIVDGNQTTRSKPDPEVFLMGAEKLQLEAVEIVVFEDAIRGIEAARKGGFHVVGVGEEEVLADADLVIPSLGSQSFSLILNSLNAKKKHLF